MPYFDGRQLCTTLLKSMIALLPMQAKLLPGDEGLHLTLSQVLFKVSMLTNPASADSACQPNCN